MDIKEEHKALLRGMGLKEEDFERFDGNFIRYEFEEEKGVRLYDPYYRTSYNEYIDADGWSAWSSEKDTFMSNILKDARRREEESKKISPRPSGEEITEALKKKFGKKVTSDSQE